MSSPHKRKIHKPNNKGRSSHSLPYTRHFIWQLSSPAWKSLSMTSRCLEMELKSLYNGQNNGDLYLSIREAALRLKIAPGTASKAFNELQEKGFIKPKQKGSFDWKKRHATTWILCEFEYNGALATKEFMRWPNVNNPVSKTTTDGNKI